MKNQGFWGHPINQCVEDIPVGAGDRYYKHDISGLLPAYLYDRYELVSFEPEIAKDPVVLRDRWHHIIYQWPEGCIPNWVDVLNVCKMLGVD